MKLKQQQQQQQHGSIFSSISNDVDQDILNENKKTANHNTIQQYIAAIRWLYANRNIPIEPNILVFFKTFMKGYKNILSDKKMKGIMSLKEGKSHLYFEGYVQLCSGNYIILLLIIFPDLLKMKPIGKQSSHNEGIFAWCYFTLTWNLCCRSHNTADLLFEHIDFENDCLVFFKGNNDFGFWDLHDIA